MADMSTKPHTRQKMRLKTMKQVNCVECSTVTRKRHVLLCFHCYCDKCFNGLAKGLMGLQTGLVCTICKSFDPFIQKEEKDDGPPVFCKIHANMRYLLNCMPCNQIVCYRCKMSDHYYHQSETIQSALDRIMPFVKRATEEEESQNAMLRRKYMENGGQVRLMKEKVDKLERYIKVDREKVEKSLKQNYKKLKTMNDDPKYKRRRIHDSQRDLTKYFMRIKLPFHTPELCPDEGAIEMIRPQSLNETEYDCEIGSCCPVFKSEDDCENCRNKCELHQNGKDSSDANKDDNKDKDKKGMSDDNDDNNEDKHVKNCDSNNKNDKTKDDAVKTKKDKKKKVKINDDRNSAKISNSDKSDHPSSNDQDNSKSSSSSYQSNKPSAKGLGPNITFNTVKLPDKSKPKEREDPVPLSSFPAIDKARQEPGMENKVMRQVHTDRNVTVLQWFDKDDDEETIKKSTNRHADIVFINGDGTVPFAQNELVEALLRSQEEDLIMEQGSHNKKSTVQITELDDDENNDKKNYSNNHETLKTKHVNGNNNYESAGIKREKFDNLISSDESSDSSSSDKENQDVNNINSSSKNEKQSNHSKSDSNLEKDHNRSSKCSQHKHSKSSTNDCKALSKSSTNDCKALSKVTKKSLKHKKHDKNICSFRHECDEQGYTVKNINEETCVATLERGGVETTITLLCEDCEKKRKGIDTMDYSEVEKALLSEEVIEIGETRVGKELISIKFTPTNNDATKLFETVDFDDYGDLFDTDTGNKIKDNVIGKIEVVKKPYKLDTTRYDDLHQALIDKAYKEKREKGEPLVETCTCYDTTTLAPFTQSFRNSNIDLKKLPSKNFKYNGFFCYGSPKVCRRMCRCDDRVYLPCIQENKYFIMQYDPINGKLLKNGRPPGGIEKPNAMYPFNEAQLLLASGNGLYLINRDTMTLECKVLKGIFSDVCMDGSRIAALEDNRSHVHIIDLSTKPPTYENIIHVEETSYDCHTIILRGDALFVSTDNHKIKKYSLKGELLWQWGSHGDGGPGFLDTPNICSVDKYESLLVVDTVNKRLQVVDSKCEWQVLELEDMENPSDAMVTDDGYLYVSDHVRSLVYWYKFDVE